MLTLKNNIKGDFTMKYQTPQMDVYLLGTSDISTTSGGKLSDGGENGTDNVIVKINELTFNR